MIRRDGGNEIVEKTKQVETRLVDVENQIDQLRFDRPLIEIDQFFQV